jgi:hypothetical protein
MSARDGDRRRVLSYEERVLWTTVTKAIAPLRATTRLAPDEQTETSSRRVPLDPRKLRRRWRRTSRRRRR